MIKVSAAAATILLSATAALAVVGTAHDFSVLGGNPCSYCHSIHNQAGGLGRPSYMGDVPDIMKVYSSATMNHKPTLATVQNSDAPLCLTCHDGANITTLASALPTNPAEVYVRDRIVGTGRDISVDLSNDHPVGFEFKGSASGDDDIKSPDDPNVNVTFGISGKEMWCSTCHNVHGGVEGTKFLVKSNGTSSLCFECHIK